MKLSLKFICLLLCIASFTACDLEQKHTWLERLNKLQKPVICVGISKFEDIYTGFTVKDSAGYIHHFDIGICQEYNVRGYLKSMKIGDTLR